MRRTRRTSRAMVLLAVVGATVLATASPAAAHNELTKMSPANGSTVTTAPTRVVLTFDQNVENVGDAVVVTDPAGTRVEAGDPVVLNNTVTTPLKPLTASGRYTVNYRIVSADGHPVTKSLGFTFAPAGSPTELADEPLEATTSDWDRWWLVLVCGLVLLAVGIGALVVWRRLGPEDDTE